MIQHFFKIFIRTTLKHKGYSLINISGLTVALVCCIFSILWILDELSYDQFHVDKARICLVETNFINNNETATYPATSGRLAEALKEFPEVEESARSQFRSRILFNYEDQSNFEEGIYADPSFFKLFTFPLVEGNPINPLANISAVAISENLAKKYFNHESAIGKTIRVNNKADLRVSAVFRNLPSQSTLQFQFVLPYDLYSKEDQYNTEWGAWTGGNTYLKLRPNTNIHEVDEKISRLITHPKIWPRWGNNVELFLFPLKDWHIRANFENGHLSGGRITYLKALGLVALFMILIACVNFMNLATARSLIRAKEIGIRKVIGGTRRSLAVQFLGESVLISFISLSMALGIAYLMLPYFNSLTGGDVEFDYSNPFVVSSLIGVTFLTGLIAGSYPAFFLSSMKALQILKDQFSGGGGTSMRKILVVFQFSLSVVLIICTLVVYQQIEFMRKKDLGFDKENVFYIRANEKLKKNFELFRQEISGYEGVNSVSRAANEPMKIEDGVELADDGWRGKTKEDNIGFQWLFCDQNFLKAFSFKIIDGRDFSSEYPSDSSNFIINEEAARRMKFSTPIGEMLKVDRKGTIVGVVRDFHGRGLDKPIQPVIISMRPERTDKIFIHYQTGHLQQVLDQVRLVYKKLEPNFPIEYKFLDDSFDLQYKNEILISKFSFCFMVIALFISCLGLFGLASFTAERKTKEIGIRKVLGATATQLVISLCRDFVVLVFVALLIGIPMAWWVGHQFLMGYAFRTEIGLPVFIVTTLSLFAIALITVSYQSAKAASANPVNSLRSE